MAVCFPFAAECHDGVSKAGSDLVLKFWRDIVWLATSLLQLPTGDGVRALGPCHSSGMIFAGAVAFSRLEHSEVGGVLELELQLRLGWCA